MNSRLLCFSEWYSLKKIKSLSDCKEWTEFELNNENIALKILFFNEKQVEKG